MLPISVCEGEVASIESTEMLARTPMDEKYLLLKVGIVSNVLKMHLDTMMHTSRALDTAILLITYDSLRCCYLLKIAFGLH